MVEKKTKFLMVWMVSIRLKHEDEQPKHKNN